MANEDFLINEKDFEIPEGWSEVGPKPQGSGAPVPAVPVDRFASGAVSTMTLGLNTDIAASKMGGDVPSYRIQPPQPSAQAANNSAVQSVTKLVPQSSGSGGGGGTAQTVSITLTAPPEINVAGSPADATGEFDLTWASENPFTVFAGPIGGANGAFYSSKSANGVSTTAAVSIPGGPNLFAFAFISQESPTITAPTTPSGFTVFDNTNAGGGAGIFLQSPATTGTIAVSSTVAGPSLGWCASVALFGAQTSVTPAIVQQRSVFNGNVNTPPQFSASKAFTSNNTAGNMILIFLNSPEIYHPGDKATPVPGVGVTDTAGNTYAQIFNNSFSVYDNLGNLANSVQQIALVAFNIIAGANTVTVQIGSGGMTGGSTIEMYEISGLGAGPGTPHFRPLTGQDVPAIPVSDLIGLVPVSGGGTGASTFTTHGVLIGEGTAAVASTTAGTAGQVLTSNGFSADPTFQNVPPYLAGFSNNTSQTSSLGSTNLVATPAVGLYRISVYEEINSGTLPVLQTNIQWTDDNGAQSATPAGTGFSTIGGFAQGDTIIRVVSGNITFTTTAAGTINYSVFLRAEFIGA